MGGVGQFLSGTSTGDLRLLVIFLVASHSFPCTTAIFGVERCGMCVAGTTAWCGGMESDWIWNLINMKKPMSGFKPWVPVTNYTDCREFPTPSTYPEAERICYIVFATADASRFTQPRQFDQYWRAGCGMEWSEPPPALDLYPGNSTDITMAAPAPPRRPGPQEYACRHIVATPLYVYIDGYKAATACYCYTKDCQDETVVFDSAWKEMMYRTVPWDGSYAIIDAPQKGKKWNVPRSRDPDGPPTTTPRIVPMAWTDGFGCTTCVSCPSKSTKLDEWKDYKPCLSKTCYIVFGHRQAKGIFISDLVNKGCADSGSPTSDRVYSAYHAPRPFDRENILVCRRHANNTNDWLKSYSCFCFFGLCNFDVDTVLPIWKQNVEQSLTADETWTFVDQSGLSSPDSSTVSTTPDTTPTSPRTRWYPPSTTSAPGDVLPGPEEMRSESRAIGTCSKKRPRQPGIGSKFPSTDARSARGKNWALDVNFWLSQSLFT